MAPKPICSIPDCGKPACNMRGWCNAHYHRWRLHGHPLGGGTKFGEPETFYQKTALLFARDECLLWPFGLTKNGYPQIWRDGKKLYVHRLICEAIKGAPPSSDHEAAHSCGVKACVSSAHLSWKTHVENEADKLLHGTRLSGAKHTLARLTETDIRTIRDLGGKKEQAEIAEIYGVSQSHVSSILSGRRWSSLS